MTAKKSRLISSRKYSPDPIIFINFGWYGRTLYPYSLLQAHLRLLRLLPRGRNRPDGTPRRSHAPRTRPTAGVSRRRARPDPLFRRRNPFALPPEAPRRLLEHAARCFDCTQVEETTLEASPDDLTPPYLDALRRIGIDRLSIGIQSFDDDCLRLMNRRHNCRPSPRSRPKRQRAGFENITVDLIFGIPGFGGDSLRRTLDTALGLGVEHISAYHLTIEPGTAFGRAARGEFAPVDEAVSEAEYALVHETAESRIRTLRSLEFRPARLPGPPQRGLLARREVPRHRSRSTFVRRPGTPLERSICRTLYRGTPPETEPFRTGTVSTNTS